MSNQCILAAYIRTCFARLSSGSRLAAGKWGGVGVATMQAGIERTSFNQNEAAEKSAGGVKVRLLPVFEGQYVNPRETNA